MGEFAEIKYYMHGYIQGYCSCLKTQLTIEVGRYCTCLSCGKTWKIVASVVEVKGEEKACGKTKKD